MDITIIISIAVILTLVILIIVLLIPKSPDTPQNIPTVSKTPAPSVTPATSSTPPIPPLPTPSTPKCTGTSYFYSDKLYRDKVMALNGKGYWNARDIKNRNFNNVISSWKIAPGCKAKMWDWEARGGNSWSVPPLPSENPWIGDAINNEISEIEISDADPL